MPSLHSHYLVISLSVALQFLVGRKRGITSKEIKMLDFACDAPVYFTDRTGLKLKQNLTQALVEVTVAISDDATFLLETPAGAMYAAYDGERLVCDVRLRPIIHSLINCFAARQFAKELVG